MRSAAVTGLCLLMLERRTERDLAHAAAELLPTVCLLLRDRCPEETRAVLSFVRVCAAVLPAKHVLPAALPQIVAALSEDALGPHKTKFSSRIRAIMRKLHQRADTEALRALLSEPDRALLTYIERRARKAARKKDVHMVDANRIDKMLGSDSEDDDGDAGSDDAASTTVHGGLGGGGGASTRRGATTAARTTKSTRVGTRVGSVMGSAITVSSLPQEDPRLLARPKAVKAGDVADAMPASLEDLLDDQPASFATAVKRTAAVAKERSSGAASSYRGRGAATSSSSSGSGSVPMSLADGLTARRADDEDEQYSVTVTADGRVVVQQRDESASDVAIDQEDNRGGAGFPGGRKGAREEAEAAAKAAEAASRKRPRLKEPGEEYRSKKAGGDVWRRGMLEPHAYIPLDPKLLSKKNTKAAVAHLGAVVKSGKKVPLASRAGAGGRGGARERKKGGNAGAAGNRKQRQASWKHVKL
jgi:ribosomal RNA-processing protein 12